MYDEDDDLVFETESNEDDTEIALVVRSLAGRKITQSEFIVQVESYLHAVAQAELLRLQTGALNH
jgi:hypothetical protein